MATWVYDGASWREATDCWVYDGSVWRNLTELWVYDGATWRDVGCGESCATASFDSSGATWTETGCSDANECQLCIRANHTDCTDPCHNIDGRVSVNGGSFTLSLQCANKSCTNQTGTDCAGEFDCNTQSGGTRCWSNSNTHKPRLEIQRDSDSGVDATWTYGSTYSGSCIA